MNSGLVFFFRRVITSYLYNSFFRVGVRYCIYPITSFCSSFLFLHKRCFRITLIKKWIKVLARGRFAGEKAVYFNSNTMGARRLLPIINPKKSID